MFFSAVPCTPDKTKSVTRFAAATAWNPGRQRTVLFGGQRLTEPTVLSDTWELELKYE